MRFEWDEEKNGVNKEKHHISFEAAVDVFYDPYRLDDYDDKHSIDEERRIVIGKAGKILYVVYTERGTDVIRLISARPATKKERMMYYGDHYYD